MTHRNALDLAVPFLCGRSRSAALLDPQRPPTNGRCRVARCLEQGGVSSIRHELQAWLDGATHLKRRERRT
jgi:hypothetical protein